MTLYDYKLSLEICKHDFSFNAMLMALIRKADTPNTKKLQQMWPDEWKEMYDRYHCPGGVLPGETVEK
jgi:hypothetical protein